MFKGLCGLLAVVFVTVLGISVAEGAECKYTDQIWGEDDPHFMYYCDPISNTTTEVPCAEGKGFVSNDSLQGCFVWTNSEWSNNCIGKEPISTSMCVGSAAKQPKAYGDPSNFYLCTSEGSMPVELSCKDGYGFYSGNKYLGCFPWATWRNLTGCINT